MNPAPSPAEEYLARLREQLRALGASDAEATDMVAEMRSNLADALAETPGADERAVVESFGDARELAAALLGERAAGLRDAGLPVAPASRRAIAWGVDVVWAAWPIALAWPALAATVALARATLSPLGLLLSLSAAPLVIPLLALSIGAVSWPIVMLGRAWRARRLGTPTLGTRVAGIVAQRTADGTRWVAADTGAAAGIPAPPHRGRARVAASLALVAVLAGLAWPPVLAVIANRQQQTTETAYRYDEVRQQAYQATAEGFTRDLYAAALGKPAAASAYLARGDKGYAAADKMLSDFFAQSHAEKVSAWTFGLADVPAVTLDPKAASRATVAIPVIETTPQGDRVATLRFIVIDPQSNSSGTNESWTLAAIDRDELRPSTAAPAAADARASVNMVLGVGGYGQGDAGNQQVDAPKRMTPEFAASADGRLLASQFGPTSTPETIGNRRDIIRVTYQGDRALVHTREEWISGAGSSQTRDYIYTVRSASPFALIERRQLTGN